MFSGFIPGSRASFAMDLVTAGMVLVVPTLTTALWMAKRHRYAVHKKIQVALSTILALVIIIFEIEVRFSGWRQNALASAYYDTWLFPVLYVHLFVAISTTVLWSATMYFAMRRFASPPRPGDHSSLHLKLARPAAIGMYLTSITGWTFYTLAFVL